MAVSAPRTAARPASGPLAGRHAVVTGASRGIGAAIAAELVRLGADVTLIARRRDSLADTARNLSGGPGRVHGVAADVTDETAIGSALADAASVLGTPAILVNNAGGAESAPFAKTD